MIAYRRIVNALWPCLIVATLIFIPCSWGAGERPAAPDSDIKTKSDQLLKEWKERFDQEKLNYVVAPPFVIAGDGSPQRLAIYRDRTILGAADRLGRQFFTTPPRTPVLILLFEGERSYKQLSKNWFDNDDPPHYGYFRHDNIMMMNVATGTGTLVHELAHALMAADFPDVPSWFNEGLASLYEQCTFGEDGTIRGLENWRLPALQKSIRDDALRPLARLIDDKNFYRGDQVGLNYAHARYVMFYLQEKGLLQTYYRQFRDHVRDDPTGLAALRKVIQPQSLEDFEKGWKKWVLTLQFPPRR